MRTFCISVAFCFIVGATYGQETPRFQTTIIVEDGIGNIDSVIIGYDPEANAEYNENFGEFDILEPYDSIFEVRAAHWTDYSSLGDPLVLSKTIIGATSSAYNSFYDCYPIIEPIVLFIRAEHQPITVSWQKNDFANSYCRIASTITTHYLPLIVSEWVEDTAALHHSACLADEISYSTDLFDYGEFGFFHPIQVKGVGQDTAYGILINYRFESAPTSPCQSLLVNQKNVIVKKKALTVYPNPGQNDLWLEYESPKPYFYQIFNISGQLQLRGNTKHIDISPLSNGIYFIEIKDDNGKIMTKKFLKQANE